jgi:mono/diheme cytochrome c family protein
VRMKFEWKTAAGIVLGLGGACGCLLQAQAQASVWDGVYAAEQAKRGEAVYAKECASCHGGKLEGKGQAPGLAGGEFTTAWNGMTVGDLFEKVQSTMPADQPGRLSGEQNAAILAFVLSVNKFPAGGAELASDAERLRGIRIEAARTKQ